MPGVTALPPSPSSAAPRPGLLVAWLATFLLLTLTAACGANRGLGDHPPQINSNTEQLPTFEPATVAAGTREGDAGLREGDARSGPPAPPEPPEPPPLPEPELTAAYPQGEASPYSEITLRFNRPMVPLGTQDWMTPAEAGLRVDPPIAGKVHWIEPTRLEFVPDDPLPLARAYTVHYEAELTAVDGPSKRFVRDWSFFTEGPSVSMHVNENHWKARVLVNTSQSVKLSTLRKHTRAEVTDAQGTTRSADIKIRALPRDRDGWREADYEIRPVGRWPADSTVVIHVDKDLVGTKGPRPMGYDEHFSFEPTGHVWVNSHTCLGGNYTDGCEIGPVEFALSTPIRRGEARKVTIEPALDGGGGQATGRRYDWRRSGPPKALDAYDTIRVWGEFEVGKTYTVTISGLKDIHGQTQADPYVETLTFVEPPPALDVSPRSGTFPAAEPTMAGVESRHLESLVTRAVVLTGETAVDAYLAYTQFGGNDPAREAPLVRALAKIPTRDHALSHKGGFAWSSATIDLQAESGHQTGLVAFEIAPGPLLARAQGRRVPKSKRGLIQLSDLGVSVADTAPRGVIRVAKLSTDAPAAGAIVELVDGKGDVVPVGRADGDGLVELGPELDVAPGQLLRVRHDGDSLLMSARELASLHHHPSWHDTELRPGEKVRAALMTERSLYKPGEVVRAMGWASVASPYELSSLTPLPKNTKVALELRDFRDELIDTATVQAKAHGKFWATLEVPDTASLGDYTVTAKLLNDSVQASLRVKDYAVPEFEVSATLADGDLHHGERTSAKVRASYYFGGPVPMTRFRDVTQCTVTDFRPPGFEPNWRVGPRREWRRHYASTGGYSVVRPITPAQEQGRMDYELTPSSSDTGLPATCKHSVAVADASEREIGAEATVWLHPQFYLGMAHTRSIEAGETLEVDARTVDYDGSARPVDSVVIELTRSYSREQYERVDGEREFVGFVHEREVLPACTTQTDGEGRAQCSFAKLEYGSYEVRVVATDTAVEGYAPSVSGYLYVHRPSNYTYLPRTPVKELTIDLSAPEAEVGDPLTVQVRAPWQQGHVVLLMVKGGLHQVIPLTLDQGRASVELEVNEAWAPGVHFTVLAVSPGDPQARVLPRLRTHSTRVDVGTDSRKLSVQVEVPKTAQPGQTLPIEVHARDYRDRPVQGHVSVWAVDEAVIALSPPIIPSFVETFSAGFGNDLRLGSSYNALLLPYLLRDDPYSPWLFDPRWREGLGLRGYGSGGGGMGSGYGRGSGAGFGGRGSRSPAMPKARSQFSSAPIFIGDAELGPDGVAHLEGTLPDNLTTFRVTAVVSSPLTEGGDALVEPRFGLADGRTRVTKPLVARAALPRVMRPGDTAELGVLVDNLRGGAGQLEVEVALVDEKGEPAADGALELLSSPQASVALDAGEQVRLPFSVRAHGTGTAQFEVRARLEPSAAGNRPVADALRLPIPVEAERTLSDRVAVYGELGSPVAAEADERRGKAGAKSLAAVMPFVLPTEIDPNYGGLSISVASSILGGVEDAVAYLVTYPHGCVEQTSSSLLPLIPLGALARQGYPMGIDDTDHYVAVGVQRLRTMQLGDGSFSYWPGGDESMPHASAYATWVLVQADQAGYHVPRDLLDGAVAFLRTRVVAWQGKPGPTLEEDIDATLALWALTAAGGGTSDEHQQIDEALTRLYDQRLRLPVFAQAYLALAIATQESADADTQSQRLDTLLLELGSRVDERQGYAKVEGGGYWTWYWDSNVRSSALVLMAFLAHEPENPMVPKLTRGLLESRRGGRWANTQENAFALLALARYAAIYEAEEPDFEGRVWLANEPVVSIQMQGRGFGFEDGFAPMAELLAAMAQPADSEAGSGKTDQLADQLILERAGTGRMYYRVGLEWASTATDLPAKAEGVAIRRSIRDAEGILGENPSIESGTLLAMDLELELHSPLDFLAAELPLPAGLEAIDMDIGKGKDAMRISGQRGHWVSHQELRRDRAVVFANHMGVGTYRTTIFLRATTPGDYVMPAATAELMYYPEIYARTTGQRVSVR
ncbi:Alpha-2-macroglobulin-like protein2 [Plesiocystis pacifica SIR-1]|uniref:Alpha-2-macroglobulin-like protein2 n=1 Tax=Plesiocystis pacifica SIR-1 TaxID=391625 RepID=A6GA42_9BACT|nr:alpha-2-macroglobulin family protein [Plesiocystis pacifica]EDM77255.1 Alpha-2-macroglobulin-like protein2 [Plesiocystis pacifica SIR-1]